MATVTLTIPDAHLTRVVNALCAAAGLPPSPANAKQAVLDHIRRTVANVERTPPEPAPEPNVDGIVS